MSKIENLSSNLRRRTEKCLHKFQSFFASKGEDSNCQEESLNQFEDASDRTPGFSFEGLSWMTSNEKECTAIPYVISVLGPQNFEEFKITPEKIEEAQKRARATLKKYLEQVIRGWEKMAGKQFPIVLLLNIAGEFGEIFHEIGVELQKTHDSLHLTVVLPLEKNAFVNQLAEEERQRFRERCQWYDSGNPKCHLMELPLQMGTFTVGSNLGEPRRERCTHETQWRGLNEFLAVNSHLMVVVWDGEKQPGGEPCESSMEWIIRFRMEGYSGEPLQSKADVLTYLAIGPLLQIQLDNETLSVPHWDILPVRYIPDNDEVTEEKVTYAEGAQAFDAELIESFGSFKTEFNKKHSLSGSCKSCRELNLEKYPLICHQKEWWKFSFFKTNIVQKKDIYNNFFILGMLNKQIWKNAESISKEDSTPNWYICSRNKSSYVPDSYRNENGNLEDLVSNLPQAVQLSYVHFRTMDHLAIEFRRKTEKLTRCFVASIGIFFLCGAILTFLSEALFRGYGFGPWYLFKYFWGKEAISPEQNVRIANFYESVFNCDASLPLDLGIVAMVLGLIVSGLLVLVCCFYSFKYWHYLYHHFRTLAEMLRVQMYWQIAGMQDAVSGNFRSHQIESLDGLRIALNGLHLPSAAVPLQLKNSEAKQNLRLLNKIWVEYEKNYLTEQLKRTWFNKILAFPFWYRYKFFAVTLLHVLGISFLCFTLVNSVMRLDGLLEAANHPEGFPVYITWSLIRLGYGIVLILFGVLLAYCRMRLKFKSRRMNEQLYVPYMLADYLMDCILFETEKAASASQKQETSSGGNAPQKEGALIKQCQQVLHQLGQEVIAKRSDWFLSATDRNLQAPKK